MRERKSPLRPRPGYGAPAVEKKPVKKAAKKATKKAAAKKEAEVPDGDQAERGDDD